MEKISLNLMNELYFTYTNWIEPLNKEFRRTFKIRNSMPNFESALTLISKVAMDKEDTYFKYPIYNFKFLSKLNASNLISRNEADTLSWTPPAFNIIQRRVSLV
ncbi:transposase [Tenacibaculum maritimum]|uniref:transposase n=2 Tax=Tenacibaculum maritimum TaxID=107401 RepID=UPI00132FF593|nr:transposase [Tenacibaculum maritimum]